MPEARYFELLDHIGVEPPFVVVDGEEQENPKAGELQPLVHQALTIKRPTMVDGELVPVVETVYLEPIERGSRTLKTDDPVIAECVAQLGVFSEVDPPRSAQAHRPREVVPPTPAPVADEQSPSGDGEE